MKEGVVIQEYETKQGIALQLVEVELPYHEPLYVVRLYDKEAFSESKRSDKNIIDFVYRQRAFLPTAEKHKERSESHYSEELESLKASE